MKTLIFIGFLAICSNVAVGIKPLGSNRCTWGPSYWCQNITNAAGCRAVKHCIQTVWEHQDIEPDTDSVCQICLKMVKEARDQLESNETQEEIKEVFEGSCKLIPIRMISSECCKLADEFIPELIDTLASQMNPQMVCSVAGLCNSERIDKLLDGQVKVQPKSVDTITPKMDTCQGCYRVVGILENKFDKMSKDQILQSFLQICGHMGSLSDSCSNIIVNYFNEIYQHLQSNFNPREVCLMAGECSAQFHTHSNVEITPLSDLGFVNVAEKDDLPCDLCKQLVGHLRDLLIANTTEDEFQNILRGLCKQTQSFQNECLSLVDEYYAVIYKFLVDQLNSTAVCSMIGICPNDYNIFDSKVQIAPLLLDEAAGKVKAILSEKKTDINLSGDGSVKIIGSPEIMQLPIERITPPHMNNIYNRQVCVFCEYFLHYVQNAITNPVTEEKIKKIVDDACQKLPLAINNTCIEFVDTYGDAFVALLAQELDPSTVCPLIRACPTADKNIEIFMQAPNTEDSKCPLCLFAVTKLEELVKDKKTEQNIKDALKTLCNHLSGQVKEECVDFVSTYTSELVEMLIADLTPQEVCVYLKLCDDKSPKLTSVPVNGQRLKPSSLTNNLGDDTIGGKPFNVGNKPNCVLCEFIMSKLDELLENKKTQDEIKAAVHTVCNYLPKSVSQQCNTFVDKYADVIIVLLTESLKPSEICAELKFCDPPKAISVPKINSPQCLLCKKIMKIIESQIPLNVTKADIEKVLKGVCSILPGSERQQCREFIEKYEDTIADLILDLASPSEICELMMLCSERFRYSKYDVRKCTSCELAVDAMRNILTNPRTDHSKKHVLEKACRALPKKYSTICIDVTRRHGDDLFRLVQELPNNEGSVCGEVNICSKNAYVRLQREIILGANKCTWGPSYWCESVNNADECGAGAKSHCQKNVWNGSTPKK